MPNSQVFKPQMARKWRKKTKINGIRKGLFMITTVRKLTASDDLSAVSNLIYETDNYVFPYFFNESKALAKAILPKMMENDTIYNINNIYVALYDEQIIGVMVLNEAPMTINLGAYLDAYEQAGVMIDEGFEKVYKEYFLPMEEAPSGYYIPNICIDPMFRGQGIGGALLETALGEVDTSKDVYLDCLSDNEVALNVYESHGFEKLVEYSGWTGLKYFKMIRRANRDII
jgi:ribosomal protein S18 acetylase RimI-like enzyme